jgi:Ca2+-binding EF-hand superfamily protein
VKSLDKNGDGKITKQEAGGAPWFDRVDQNNDGVLDATELETVRQASATWPGGGSTPNPGAAPQGGGQLIERIKSLDTNGDGRITKEEAGGAAWFGRADRNNDGVIDAAELEALRRGTGARRGVTNR